MPAAEAPNNKIVFFDGGCALCAGFVDFVRKKDRRGVFRLTPFSDPSEKSILLKDHKGLYRKSDAALRILAELSSAWRVLAVLLILPSFLRDPVYDLVARNRHQWFGKTACRKMSANGDA